MHIHGFYIIPILIFHVQRAGVTFPWLCQYIYLFSMVVYMVEVKGGRGMYVDIFLIFDVEKRSFLTLCHNVFPRSVTRLDRGKTL